LLYHAYELQRSWLNGASAWASIGAEMLARPTNPFGYLGMGTIAASALDVFAHATAPRGKPEFAIDPVEIDGESYRVDETTVLTKPFGDLKKFRRDGLAEDAPSLLIVPADRCPDERPLCHIASRHGGTDGRKLRSLHHRLGRCPYGAFVRRSFRPR
jgi:poly-beta-hydroxyalkanoate depolymerase